MINHMKQLVKTLSLSTIAAMPIGCAGSSTPGYWFQTILIVIPIFVLGYLLINRLDNLNDSIFSIERKINELSNKMNQIEKSGKNRSEKE